MYVSKYQFFCRDDVKNTNVSFRWEPFLWQILFEAEKILCSKDKKLSFTNCISDVTLLVTVYLCLGQKTTWNKAKEPLVMVCGHSENKPGSTASGKLKIFSVLSLSDDLP